ncbi:GerAB/ArcD/ProY family transporter [Ornithinibacillus halophilus]|uniref:Spore germination protein (Amino acid permease) n=1 Tax=Ornithinibacillus halophilus TaxID=930117 RepID=A0A1M5HX54_9BACI|nr:GerAB/ArcD/ProY family transporter [Ornithinibacillus halophilus]SHG20564.1 spore germination protein (amino acid permease) [Ornithinibacillus halophilus]
MDISPKIRNNLKVRPLYILFMIFGLQVGVGIMGAPRFIFMESMQDSWISILIAWAAMVIVIYVMFQILKQYPNADIFGIQVDLFGKWVGSILGTIYILFFLASLLSVLLTYVNVIQLFLYPTFPPIIIGSSVLLLAHYCVIGGVRSVVGAAFLFSVLPLWLLFLLYDPITRMDWYHFLPVFQSSIPELLKGAKSTTYTLTGFEILFVFYPFLTKKNKVLKPALFGVTATTILLLIFMIISIGYFSPDELKKDDWATLTLFKSVSYPFIERLDYIVVVGWMMVILPNLVILLWASSYGLKRLYRIKQKSSLHVTFVVLIVLVGFIKENHIIYKITDYVSQVSFWLIFVYPLILLPIVLIKKKWLSKKKKGSDAK